MSGLTYIWDALRRGRHYPAVKVDQLKLRLGQILAEEEGGGSVDWHNVTCLADELLGELQVPIPLIVNEYLRGADRRRQDSLYAHAQRSQLLHFLRGH
jgi:hypothetical protein